MNTLQDTKSSQSTTDKESAETFLDIDLKLRQYSEHSPDKLALADNNKRITWQSLDQRVNRIANQLLSHKITSEDTIAILGRNSIDYAAIFLGAVRAGVCVAPLPAMASSDSLAMMINDSGAKRLFVSAESFPLIAPVLKHFDSLSADQLIIFSGQVEAYTTLDEYSHGASSVSPPIEPEEQWRFNLIYSSGTTGTPKGIIHDRRFRAIESQVFEGLNFNSDTRGLISTPLYSQTSLFFFFAVLSNGGAVYLMPKFSTAGFFQLAAAEKITHTVMVPVQYKRLLDDPLINNTDLSSFEFKCSTSAPLHHSEKRRILDHWPEGGLWEFYGMTEGGVNCCLPAHAHSDKLDTVGQPAQGCDLRIINEQGEEVSTGEAGEIVGSGTRIMVGYHNRPEATADASWYNQEGRRFHRSGDIGWLDEENFLHLLDRKKDMIISGGFNVYAIDLEKVILTHSKVNEVAVIAKSSDRWGEVPVAFIVQSPGASIDLDDLKQWANQQLGKAQRIDEILLVDQLPRSPIGKVLKRELRDSFYPAVSRSLPP